MTTRHMSKSGFTLIEMAMVLLIVALLLGGGLTVLSTQIEQQKFKDTQKSLEDAKEALIGYAASHTETGAPATRPYLPCPDKTTAAGIGTPNDGLEDRAAAGGGCVVASGEGNLPWVTLGLAGTDSWGNRFRYRVTPAFSNSVTGMLLTSAGTLTVNNQSLAPQAAAVPVVILSHGHNGWGATSSAGVVIAAPPGANLNETENTNGNTTFVSSAPGETGAVGGEFDDIVTWLPATILFNRMLQATKLP